VGGQQDVSPAKYTKVREFLHVFIANLKVSTSYMLFSGSCHKRQKPQAPIRKRQTIKVSNAKVLHRNTNLT